ncbi:MAG TPA: hypothetical protein PLF22_01650 [Pseudomonadales bacterium]|nr:hypothetical protein [Pseudomonadales bacterium]
MKPENNRKLISVLPLFAFLVFSVIPVESEIFGLIVRFFILISPMVGLYFSIRFLRVSESAVISMGFILAISLYSLLEAFVIYIEAVKFLGGR